MIGRALRWIGTMLLAAGIVVAAEMKASKPDVRKEVAAVIEAQLAAFRRGATSEAHALASAELRAQKPLAVFSRIVQSSYPEIWANTRSELGIVRDDGARARVVVQVYAKSGDAGYDYELVKERAGWRIHGVVRHEAKGSKV